MRISILNPPKPKPTPQTASIASPQALTSIAQQVQKLAQIKPIAYLEASLVPEGGE